MSKKSKLMRYFESEQFKEYVDSPEFQIKATYTPIKSKKDSHGVEISLIQNEDWKLLGFNSDKIWEWSEGEDIEINIHNIVLTAKLNREFNLEFLVRDLIKCGAQYNKKEFAAIVIRSGSISLLLFSLGNIVCTGAKNIEEAVGVLRKLENILAEKGKPCNLINLKIQNIVVCVKLKWKIDLKKFAHDYSQICNYAEDVFPGAIIKHPEFDRNTSLLFDTGYMVIAGLKKREELEKILLKIPPLIKPYRILQVEHNVSLMTIIKKPKSQKICVDPNELITPMNENIKKKIDDILQISPTGLFQRRSTKDKKKKHEQTEKEEVSSKSEREGLEIDHMPEFGLDEFRETQISKFPN